MVESQFKHRYLVRFLRNYFYEYSFAILLIMDPSFFSLIAMRLLKDARGLSQPVTTMILLVIPVMLTGGVAMYAYQIIGNQTEMEILMISNQRIWIYDDGASFAALQIDNVGGKDAFIDEIQVRGVEAPWSTVHYFRSTLLSIDTLNCPNASGNDWSMFEYTPGNSTEFLLADGDLTLPSGYTLVIYIEHPDNIRLEDIGASVSISVITKNARYELLCIVQSAI